MTLDLKLQKKQILSDPVAAYSTLYPNANKKKLASLNELQQQHLVLLQQHKEIKTQTRKISRKIGIAKHNGGSIDDLKTNMQEQSTRLRDITDRLSTTKNSILDFFTPGIRHQNPESVPVKIPQGRIYSTPCNQSEISITLLNNDIDEWNAYASRKPAASIYHRAEWRELIQKTFGHEGSYFIAKDKNRIVVGILPLIRLKSSLFGDFMVSMPYFNYGGAIADNMIIEQQLMEAANQHASKLGVNHIEYRDDITRDDLPVRSEKVNMILSLPDTFQELWEGFTPKLRAQIRRPLKENPRIQDGGMEHLDDFYAVFSRNMRDLGTPVYSRQFFRNILEYFPEKSRIIIIRLDNRPVAAGFLIGHGDTLEIPWASTIRDVNQLSMNMLLYQKFLKFAVENKYSYFNFGRSSKDSGTYRFKQQWGAVPKQLHWHYWLNSGCELPSLNPDNPKYALVIKLWKHLPLAVTKILGPRIVRNLP